MYSGDSKEINCESGAATFELLAKPVVFVGGVTASGLITERHCLMMLEKK